MHAKQSSVAQYLAHTAQLGSVREILGNGTLFGMHLFSAGFKPSILLILPPGAFLVLGFLMAANRYIDERIRVKRGEQL